MHFIESHLHEKNVQNGGASLDSYFKASWLHAWKISNHLELYNIQDINSEEIEVENDSKY